MLFEDAQGLQNNFLRLVVELYTRMLFTLVFAGALAVADEPYGFDIADKIVLLGPSVNLVSELESTEMGDEYGLGALLPLHVSDGHERVDDLDDLLPGELFWFENAVLGMVVDLSSISGKFMISETDEFITLFLRYSHRTS